MLNLVMIQPFTVDSCLILLLCLGSSDWYAWNLAVLPKSGWQALWLWSNSTDQCACSAAALLLEHGIGFHPGEHGSLNVLGLKIRRNWLLTTTAYTCAIILMIRYALLIPVVWTSSNHVRATVIDRASKKARLMVRYRNGLAVHAHHCQRTSSTWYGRPKRKWSIRVSWQLATATNPRRVSLLPTRDSRLDAESRSAAFLARNASNTVRFV